MGTLEIILLAFTLIEKLGLIDMVKKLIAEGHIEENKGPELLVGILQAIIPVSSAMVVKNNPEWESVVKLIAPVIETLVKKEE